MRGREGERERMWRTHDGTTGSGTTLREHTINSSVTLMPSNLVFWKFLHNLQIVWGYTNRLHPANLVAEVDTAC